MVQHVYNIVCMEHDDVSIWYDLSLQHFLYIVFKVSQAGNYNKNYK